MPHAHSSVAIVPSLPAKSFAEIEALIEALDGTASEIQIDIVDGVYAPFTSWPFTEPRPVEALQKLVLYTKKFLLEVDCMVSNPEQYLDIFVQIGVSRVVIHAGSTKKYRENFAHAESHGYSIGLAVTNDTSLAVVEKYIDDVAYVQVMGIKEIGQQGQAFDIRTLDTVRTLRLQYPELEIAVDGAVNEKTMPLLYTAGVTRFAPGSAVAKAHDPKASYTQLLSLVT